MISTSREHKLAARMIVRDTLRGIRARLARGVPLQEAIHREIHTLSGQIEDDKAALNPYRLEDANG